VQSDHYKLTAVNVTGGGAYKFRQLVEEQLGIKVIIQDEMTSMLKVSLPSLV
jgi:pantothenate kinase